MREGLRCRAEKSGGRHARTRLLEPTTPHGRLPDHPLNGQPRVRSTPIFGGLDDKTDNSEPPAADAPALHIDALTMVGGVAIKQAK